MRETRFCHPGNSEGKVSCLIALAALSQLKQCNVLLFEHLERKDLNISQLFIHNKHRMFKLLGRPYTN